MMQIALNIDQEKIANFKSPVYKKLENMIETLAMFRNEMDGNRVPKYEQTYLLRKKKDIET